MQRPLGTKHSVCIYTETPEKVSEKAVRGKDIQLIFDFDIRDVAVPISKKEANSKMTCLAMLNERNIAITKEKKIIYDDT